MEDAKSRKTEWKHRLGKLELESLLSLRDTLMAKGGLYMLVINDSKRNAEQITKYVSVYFVWSHNVVCHSVEIPSYPPISSPLFIPSHSSAPLLSSPLLSPPLLSSF